MLFLQQETHFSLFLLVLLHTELSLPWTAVSNIRPGEQDWPGITWPGHSMGLENVKEGLNVCTFKCTLMRFSC